MIQITVRIKNIFEKITMTKQQQMIAISGLHYSRHVFGKTLSLMWTMMYCRVNIMQSIILM